MKTNEELIQRATVMMRDAVFRAAKNNFDGRAVLMFSGGRDSSAVAAVFCRAFPEGQLYLLLVDNGLLSRLDNARRQANLIKRLFPDTDIIFEMKRVSEMMRRVGMQAIEKDFTQRQYSTLLICLTCKIIMSISAARFARDVGTRIVLDGFADRQNDYPEQTEEFMVIIRQFFNEAGILYLSPLYELLTTREIVDQLVHSTGVYIPKQEPICMWANSFSVAKAAEISKYTAEKLKEVLTLDPILNP